MRTFDPDDDFSDLEPLRDIVGDARVVAIGESTHRIHEFYEIRHRLARFLIAQLGFTAHLDSLLWTGITYHMGRCAEVRNELTWLRGYNAGRARPVRFYGMDVSDSSASARPAVQAVLPLLDRVDPAYAEQVRRRLPLFDYLPADRVAVTARHTDAFLQVTSGRRPGRSVGGDRDQFRWRRAVPAPGDSGWSARSHRGVHG